MFQRFSDDLDTGLYIGGNFRSREVTDRIALRCQYLVALAVFERIVVGFPVTFNDDLLVFMGYQEINCVTSEPYLGW